jgi:hypothetical protein
MTTQMEPTYNHADMIFKGQGYKKYIHTSGQAADPNYMPRGQRYTLKHLQIIFVTKQNDVTVVPSKNLAGKVIITRPKEKNCFKCRRKVFKKDRVKKGLCQRCQYDVNIPLCGFCGGVNVKTMHPCTNVPPKKVCKSVSGKVIQKILCTQCPPHKYYSYGSFKRHVVRAHGSEVHRCDHVNCNKYFLDRLNLSQHTKVHADPTHKCTVCPNKMFVHQSELSIHMQTAHPDVQRNAQWVNEKTKETHVVALQSVTHNDVTTIDQFLMGCM